MKTILTHLGKIVIMCAYWALVALFVWLFYDEYITKQTWTSLCISIAFASAGLGLYGPIVYWLYKTELTPKLDLFKLNHPKNNDLLETFIIIILAILGAISLIFFLIGLLGDILYCTIYGTFLIIHQTWEYWVLMILLFLICIILKVSESPFIKSISKITFRISLLSSMVLITYIFVQVNQQFANTTNTLLENSITDGNIFLIIVFIFYCVLLYHSVTRGIFSFARLRYVLFLRAFKDDESVTPIYNKISKSIKNIPLIKIGNPTLVENKNSNEHWLPLRNWKFFLKFYIAKAKVIVAVPSLTDGVMWEITQIIKYLNKCVIVFGSPSELEDFKKTLLSLNKENIDVLIHSIDYVLNNCLKENAFIIQHDRIYLGEVCLLINSIINNDFKHVKTIKTPEIITTSPTTRKNHKISNIEEFLSLHFHILNFINITEYVHNKAFRTLFKSVFYIIMAVLYILRFLMGIVLTLVGIVSIIYPLYIWFGDKWLDMGYENYSITEKIFWTWFFIGFGLGLLKYLFKKIKNN